MEYFERAPGIQGVVIHMRAGDVSLCQIKTERWIEGRKEMKVIHVGCNHSLPSDYRK